MVMSIRFRRAQGVVAGALLAGACLSACGSSGGGSATATTGKSPSSAAPGVSSKTSGTPVDIVSINDEVSAPANYIGVLNASVDAVNAAGGIGGHPLSIQICNTNNNPNTAASCVRSAAANPNVKALVGDSTSYGDEVDSLMTADGLAGVGTEAFSAADTTATSQYLVTGGEFTNDAGALMMVHYLHAKRIGYVTLDIPAGHAGPPQIESIVKPFGASVSAVYVPLSSPDVSSQVAQILSQKPQVIFLATDTDTAGRVVQALETQNSKIPVLLPGEEFDANEVKATFGSSPSVPIYISSWVQQQGPGWTAFTTAMARYFPSANEDGDAINEWMALQLFVHAMGGSASTSRAQVTAALNGLSSYSTGGLTPVVNFTKPQTALSGQIPRVVNPTAYGYHYSSGTFTPLTSGFINPFTYKP